MAFATGTAPIKDVIEGDLAPHRPGQGSRIDVSGPEMLLPPKPALAIALAVHELATNAAKPSSLESAPYLKHRTIDYDVQEK